MSFGPNDAPSVQRTDSPQNKQHGVRDLGVAWFGKIDSAIRGSLNLSRLGKAVGKDMRVNGTRGQLGMHTRRRAFQCSLHGTQQDDGSSCGSRQSRSSWFSQQSCARVDVG